MYSDLPSTPIGTLRLFASTQTQIDKFSDDLIASVKQGEVSPLEVLIQLKAFEKVAQRVLKEIKENVNTEAEKYEQTFEIFGNKIEKAELGTKYDFSVCNDPAWDNFTHAENSNKFHRQEREKMLKALKEPMTLVDETTGEVVKVMPPLKTSTTGVKVHIK